MGFETNNLEKSDKEKQLELLRAELRQATYDGRGGSKKEISELSDRITAIEAELGLGPKKEAPAPKTMSLRERLATRNPEFLAQRDASSKRRAEEIKKEFESGQVHEG
ncbi:MAG: hypothetical protein WC797_00630 [Candidatus Paceibacterota bacterium]|jgi:hypothetical protein